VEVGVRRGTGDTVHGEATALLHVLHCGLRLRPVHAVRTGRADVVAERDQLGLDVLHPVRTVQVAGRSATASRLTATEPRGGLDRHPLSAREAVHREVKVRAGRTAGVVRAPYKLTLADALAGRDEARLQVVVAHPRRRVDLQEHVVPGGGVVARGVNLAGHDRVGVRAVADRVVHALVELATAVDRAP